MLLWTHSRKLDPNTIHRFYVGSGSQSETITKKLDPGLVPLTLADLYPHLPIFRYQYKITHTHTGSGTYQLFKSYTVVSEILIGIKHLKKKVVTKKHSPDLVIPTPLSMIDSVLFTLSATIRINSSGCASSLLLSVKLSYLILSKACNQTQK